MITDIIIPAYNEEDAIGKVVSEIPQNLVREVVVVNNGSTDNTSQEAQNAGATVIDEPKSGYGNACLKGIAYLSQKEKQADVIVFLDGDYSDYPEEVVNLLTPIKDTNIDMVIGSRATGERAKGSMTVPQLFGNWLATRLMALFYGSKFTDLGPFRAIKFDKLLALNMVDRNYGWTIEMQIKALKAGLKVTEVPVNYRNRIGQSKVSGTVKGVFGAGYKIIATIFRYL